MENQEIDKNNPHLVNKEFVDEFNKVRLSKDWIPQTPQEINESNINKTHYGNLPDPSLIDEMVNYNPEIQVLTPSKLLSEEDKKKLLDTFSKQPFQWVYPDKTEKIDVQYSVGFDPYKNDIIDTDTPKLNRQSNNIIFKYPPKKVAAIQNDVTTQEYKRRRTGQTTRLIDEIVQSLFNGNEVEVKDHPKGGRDLNCNLELLEKILDRFRAEHNSVYIVDYRKTRDKSVIYLIFNSAELTLKLETHV